MKRTTAIRRLRTIAESCDHARPLWENEPTLVAAYAFGMVLDPEIAELPGVDVAFVLDLPAEELPWGARPQSCLGLVSLLRLDKAPVNWFWRPSVWPVWNHKIRRPLLFWSPDGSDDEALDGLSSGDVERLRLPAPSREDEAEQLVVELDASLTYLRRVRDEFWERDWRQENRGFGVHPEDHLWNAVDGYLDLHDAVRAQSE